MILKLTVLVLSSALLFSVWYTSPENTYTLRCDGMVLKAEAWSFSYGSGGCVYLKNRLWFTQLIKCNCDTLMVGKREGK